MSLSLSDLSANDRLSTDLPNNPANNLPQQLTSFVGRGRELAEIEQLLQTERCVTLTGVGGCGKTRLSLQAATNLMPKYSDGVLYVELANVIDPVLIPYTVALVLGIHEQPGQSLIDDLCKHLQSLNLLLVLDNCEHLAEACASLVHTLLSTCPSLRILATSRQALNFQGEILWPVPALSVPDMDQKLPLDILGQYEAIQLFLERAHTSRSGFSMTKENASSVVQVCYQLDGLPLAIELAAARVKVLSVEQIAARLSECFRLLISDSKTIPTRQQTLTALMDWSYDLLSLAERTLFRRLSIFVGTFALEAIEVVCHKDNEGDSNDAGDLNDQGDESSEFADEYEVIDLLSHLVDKSLLVVDEHKGQARYHLLETIKQYAQGKLSSVDSYGEILALSKRHRDWYLGLAEQAQAKLVTAEQVLWLDRLELEHNNLRAALDCSISKEVNTEAALRLCGALWRFWDIRGYITEGRKWLGSALEMDGISSASALVRAKACNAAGNLALEQSDYGQAVTFYEEALAIRREMGDKQGIARSLSNLGVAARRKGDYNRATQLYQESLSILQELGNIGDIASVLDNLGFVKQYQGHYEQADELYSQALTLFRQIEDKQATSMALNNRGKMAQYRGDYGKAKALYEEALELVYEVGDKLSIIGVLNNLASIANHKGDYKQAEALFMESLYMCQQLGCNQETADCLEGLAIAVAHNQPKQAAHLFGAAQALRDKIRSISDGHDIHTYIANPLPTKHADYDRYVSFLRDNLGENAFEVAWAIGRTMSVEEALAFPPDATRKTLEQRLALPLPLPPYPAGLSRREVQVLRMVAAGMTNSQVAEKLSVSQRTINAHLRTVYSKVGNSNRNATTWYAIENNLL